MRMRFLALLLLSVWLAPSTIEAGLFGSDKKKLPKPKKMVHIRPHDAEKYSKLTKVGAKYAPAWGLPKPLSEQPVRAHLGHYVAFDE